MVVTNLNQFADDFAAVPERPPRPEGVAIVGALPNPAGPDRGRETVTLKNSGTASVLLTGWKLRDRASNEMVLGELAIAAGETEEVTVQGRLSLNNDGDEILLLDRLGNVIHEVSYDRSLVVSGQPIFF